MAAEPPEAKFLIIMSVTVNLSAEEVAQIKRATEVDDEKEAVTKAVREFLRVAGLRELKAASGKVDYVGVEASGRRLGSA